MIDTWLCRRYPGGLPVGVTRDTRRNRSVPGEIHSRDTWRTRRLPVNLHSLDSRRTRGLPGGSYVLGYSGHVAGSKSIREGVLRLRHSGTHVSFGKLPEGGRGISRLGSRCGLRDAWCSCMASGGVILASALGTG